MASTASRSGSTAPSCAPGRCTTGPTRRFMTMIITAVFPIYFVEGRRRRTCRRAAPPSGSRPSNTIGLADHRASLSPILGAIADYARDQEAAARRLHAARRRRGRRDVLHPHAATGCWRRCCSSSPTSAPTASFVFYDALLPHIAAPDEIDRVSTAGYALGYLGGGLLLALNLAWIQKPEWFGLPSGRA